MIKNKIYALLRILFLIIYIIKPVKYCHNHDCYSINSSGYSIEKTYSQTPSQQISSSQGNIHSIILAKNGVDAFSATSNPGRMTATGSAGSDLPGGGGGSGSSSSEICPKDPAPKFGPQVSMHPYQPAKTEKQKKRDKYLKELAESIREERKINSGRNIFLTLIIKDGRRWFAPHDQLRDKFYHAYQLGVPVPPTLDMKYAMSLSYKERLEYFRNKTVLPDEYVKMYGIKLRYHVLNPDTEEQQGTLGANREQLHGVPKHTGFHFYNEKTGFDAFFDEQNNRYRTGMILNEGQKDDLELHQNVS